MKIEDIPTDQLQRSLNATIRAIGGEARTCKMMARELARRLVAEEVAKIQKDVAEPVGDGDTHEVPPA